MEFGSPKDEPKTQIDGRTSTLQINTIERHTARYINALITMPCVFPLGVPLNRNYCCRAGRFGYWGLKTDTELNRIGFEFSDKTGNGGFGSAINVLIYAYSEVLISQKRRFIMVNNTFDFYELHN